VPKVTVEDQDITFKASAGANLREAMLKHKAKLYHGLFNKLFNCHGHGLCGTCLVRVTSNPAGLTDRSEVEKKKLFESSPNTRLACQAEICGDVTVNCEAEYLSDEKETATRTESKK